MGKPWVAKDPILAPDMRRMAESVQRELERAKKEERLQEILEVIEREACEGKFESCFPLLSEKEFELLPKWTACLKARGFQVSSDNIHMIVRW